MTEEWAEPGSLTQAPLIVVTALPGATGGLAVAAGLGVATSRRGGDGQAAGVILLDATATTRRRPTLISSGPARALEDRLRGELPVAARGTLCWASPQPGHALGETLDLCRAAGAALVVAFVRPETWRALIDEGAVAAAVLRADIPRRRSLAGLAAVELTSAGVPAAIVPQAPGLVASRRALAGIEPGGPLGARSERVVRRLLGDGRPARRPVAGGGAVATRRPNPGESGQALPLVLGLAMALVVAALGLALLGAAATGASRLQRGADLAAVSAARSMRDDHHRLFVAARTASGAPNPAHLSDAEYRARAGQAAVEAAAANGLEAADVEVSFPHAGFAPTRVRVELSGRPTVAGRENPNGDEVAIAAVAEASPVAVGDDSSAGPATASGGGYGGRLVYRQGEGMRPDVGAAYDRMAAAASASGHALIVNSGFRSDAEQAELFAANPDPRWVAPPGSSLHRCATELDIGPPSAYGWLAANAPRFGFEKRYSWEPWHFGFVAGPPPCSAAGDRVAAGSGGDGAGSATALPAFVPARFREPLARAASRWNVSAALLAAQLLAESNFNPFAVSPAGASGIAQFMPGTALAYGLGDPFDPVAAIDAQAHLMSDLLGQFGSIPLALAAYNAGPAPVAACGCVPPYPETQGYVARILGLLGGAGEIAPPALEVRLVE